MAKVLAVVSTDMYAGIMTIPATEFRTGTPESSPDTEDGPRCSVCGAGIPYSGKGRKPTKCDEHKTRTNDKVGSSQTPRKTAVDARTQARMDALTGDLLQGAAEFAGTVSLMMPVTGQYTMNQAPAGIPALVRAAAKHPRMLDGLEAVAKVSPWITVGQFLCGLIYALLVDLGQATPMGIAAEGLGVAQAAAEAGWEPPKQKTPTVEGFVIPTAAEAPPAFNY